MLIKVDESCLEAYADLRLDKFLQQYLAALTPISSPSRTYLQDLIKSGSVLVNTKPVKASYSLELDDEVEINIPEARELEIVAENIPLDIVYEDDDLLVVNKPINMITHPAPGVDSGTLVNALLYHLGQSRATALGLAQGIARSPLSINGVFRPGIVQRLDKDTSGLMVVAKNDLAQRSLTEQIQSRKLERRYLALVEGNIRTDTGKINFPIGRHPVHRQRMAVLTEIGQKSRHALTYYTVVERYKFKNLFFTLLECKLDTGRTHQIRVHLSHLKHPIIGDYNYGASHKFFRADRPMLHSYSIKFEHPGSHQGLAFERQPPPDMERILDILREQNELV